MHFTPLNSELSPQSQIEDTYMSTAPAPILIAESEVKSFVYTALVGDSSDLISFVLPIVREIRSWGEGERGTKTYISGVETYSVVCNTLPGKGSIFRHAKDK